MGVGFLVFIRKAPPVYDATTSTWPVLADHGPMALPRLDVDGDKISRHRDPIQSYATDPGDLGVDSCVVMTEKADPRTEPRQQHIQPLCLADVRLSPSVPGKAHACRRIVCQHDVHLASIREPLDLVPRIVTLRGARQAIGSAQIIRRAVTPADASDADVTLMAVDEIGRVAVAQIRESGQNPAIPLSIQPHEIFVIALDEQAWPRRRSPRTELCREIARSIVLPRRPVDPTRIRPDPEVADLQDVVEANPEDPLEGEDVLVEAVHGSVNVARRADEHCKHSFSRSMFCNVDPIEARPHVAPIERIAQQRAFGCPGFKSMRYYDLQSLSLGPGVQPAR